MTHPPPLLLRYLPPSIPCPSLPSLPPLPSYFLPILPVSRPANDPIPLLLTLSHQINLPPPLLTHSMSCPYRLNFPPVPPSPVFALGVSHNLHAKVATVLRDLNVWWATKGLPKNPCCWCNNRKTEHKTEPHRMNKRERGTAGEGGSKGEGVRL